MIIMSADLGLKRTGVAVSDISESFAFPKTVIVEYNTDRLIEKLIDCAKQYSAELVVMGLPKNMDGSEGSRAATCREIAEKFEKASGIKAVLWDERSTTVMAHNILSMNDKRGQKRKEAVDAVAAVIILEGYLAARKNRKV